MIDWNDLRFALAVARTGSLSGAARSLGVHQTTAGRRLTALESSLGFPIFLRRPRGLIPSADGRRVLRSLEELATSLSRFEVSAQAEQSGMRGSVRVAVTEATARMIVETTVPALLATHPELTIEVVSANVATNLESGDADFAVRLLKPPESLIARRLGSVHYGLYASERYIGRHGTKFSAGLVGHEIVAPSQELAGGPEAKWLAQHAAQARCVFKASSHVTLALAAEQGLGLSALPTNLAAMHPRLVLMRALPEIPRRPVWLVMHPDVRRVPRVRVVANAVGEEVRRRLQ